MGPDLIDAISFWQFWDHVVAGTHFRFAEEPDNFAEIWRKVSVALPKGAKSDADAYLAAFAIAEDSTLVSFDGGFVKFAGLKLLLLS